MGNIQKRTHSASFKTKVALELIQEKDTTSSICSRYAIHPTQARSWKAQAMETLQSGFAGISRNNELKQRDQLIDELYKEIGQLKVELDWLKKKFSHV